MTSETERAIKVAQRCAAECLALTHGAMGQTVEVGRRADELREVAEALRHLIAEARKVPGLIQSLKRETDGHYEVRQQLNLVKTNSEGVWRWQGDGDDPESLSCPVVMSADTLRGFLAEARKAAKVKAKYATLRPEVGGENYDVAQAWDEGFHEAWEDVMLIIAPDAETKEVSRG